MADFAEVLADFAAVSVFQAGVQEGVEEGVEEEAEVPIVVAADHLL